MARAIDGDALKNQIRHMPRTINPDLVQYSLVQAIIADMPTLTPQNDPLTIEQLREMDGEPVWVVLTNKKWSRLNGWYLVRHGSAYLARIDDWELDAKEYGVEWIAYSRPPEKKKEER